MPADTAPADSPSLATPVPQVALSPGVWRVSAQVREQIRQLTTDLRRYIKQTLTCIQLTPDFLKGQKAAMQTEEYKWWLLDLALLRKTTGLRYTCSQCRRGIRSSHLRSLHWEQQSLLLTGTQSYIFRSSFSSLFLCSEGPQVNLQYYYLIIKQKTNPNHFVFGTTFSFSAQIFTSMYHRIGNNDFKYATPKCHKY